VKDPWRLRRHGYPARSPWSWGSGKVPRVRGGRGGAGVRQGPKGVGIWRLAEYGEGLVRIHGGERQPAGGAMARRRKAGQRKSEPEQREEASLSYVGPA
jgi:hypothetical protein